MRPLVAIITRTRNRARFLERAMQSVLAQSVGDWQHIIVNDGGERGPVDELVERFGPSYGERLEVRHLEPARGMMRAANDGIVHSDSLYICIHDDDDHWDPRFLEVCVQRLEEEGVGSPTQGVITRTVRIDERLNDDGSLTEIGRHDHTPLDAISLFRVGYENPFPPIAFCYRRRVHDRIGLFDPRWDFIADRDFNFRFLRRYEIAVLDERFAFYHWRQEGGEEANVSARSRQHERLVTAWKNHYLRSAKSPAEATAALALNISKVLSEAEWMNWEVRREVETATRQWDELGRQLPGRLRADWEKIWQQLQQQVLQAEAANRAEHDRSNRRVDDLDTRWRQMAAQLDKVAAQLTSVQAEQTRQARSRSLWRVGPFELVRRSQDDSL